jgi:TPM domain
MRTARLLAVIATILVVGLGGGLPLAPPATAQSPFRLADYITDHAGALSKSGRSAATSAVDKLYADRHIRLWVVYVDDFSGQTPTTWAQRTVDSSGLGDYDALLAVATTGRAYAFLVPSAIKGVNASRVDDLRRNKIEPALHSNDWSGAAVAAARGLDPSPGTSGRVMLLVALAVILAAVLVLLLVMRYRGRRRRAAALAAALRVDPTDVNALAAVSPEALDDLSRALVVGVDNAVRTSANELDLAVAEFGDERTQPFTQAVTNAKAALSQAFTVRQQLDDNTPETPAQRRELLTRVIVSAARADRELDSQSEAFEKLRDLVINAPSRLNTLTQQYVELTTRITPAEQRLAALHNDFNAAALTSVSGNITAAKGRLAFADRNIGSAAELAAHEVSGQQTSLVDAVRAAESALGQARALLDAVENAASDIQHAVARMPSVMADIANDITRADELLRITPDTKSAHGSDLVAARDAATRAVENAYAGASDDPLGAFAQLTKADAGLNGLLATLAQEQATAEQLNRSLEQASFTAQSRVRAVSDYIDTRRGSIGPEARTRLAEAKRHLQAAAAGQRRCAIDAAHLPAPQRQ